MFGALLAATVAGVVATTSVGQPALANGPNAVPAAANPVAGQTSADGPVLVPPGKGSPELERLRRTVAASGARAVSAAADPQCWINVRIRSNGNGLYVAAEQGSGFPEPGMLRARTPGNAIGTWELFHVCRDPVSWETAILADNGRGVDIETSATDTRGGLLRARVCCSASFLFTTYRPPGSGTTLNETWFYSTQAKLFVSAQLDYSGTYHASLRARLGQVGPWESFSW